MRVLFWSFEKNPYLAKLKTIYLFMKRITLLIYLTTLTVATALAVPAKPGKMQHTQSDGTVVTFEVVGDEFNNHLLVDGQYTAMWDGNNICYATSQNGLLKSSGVAVRPTNRLNTQEKAIAQSSIGLRKMIEDPLFSSDMNSPERVLSNRASVMPPYYVAPNESALELGGWGGEVEGERNLLVILVQYTDIKFSINDARNKFDALLNEPGYSENGATGSTVDYFEDASNGKFNPNFDVVGPYTLSNNRKFYGGNNAYGDDAAPAIQTKEACDLAAADGVDFSKYDGDNDGKIDLVFIVYAGHNPAEGGPADAVWPHQWDIYPGSNIVENSYPVYNGKQLVTYACSSELKGYRGTNMSSIGTFCHEFGHAIGLPDWYDTSGGDCFGMDFASIMNAGNYLNDSRTPPTYNILERWLLGWYLPKEMHSAGKYEIDHVSNNDGYILWANEGKTECFLFESRAKGSATHWDQYLNNGDSSRGYEGGEGMLIYHVDWTGSYYGKWSAHRINTDPNHQCAYLFRANPNATSENSKGWFFPGSRNVTSLSYDTAPVFQNWNKERLPFYYTDIKVEGGGKVSFNALMKDFSMDVRQYDMIANWEASSHNYSSWRVVCTNTATGESQEVKTNNKYAMVEPLTVATAYHGAIYADGVSDPLYEFNFTTQSNVIIPRSSLQLDATHKSGDLIRLSVKNLDCTPAEIVWYVDGKASDPYIRLNAGKHQVCAVITDTEGNAQYLYRYITVQ